MVKLRSNKKSYLEFFVVIVVVLILPSIQVYAQSAVRPLINRFPYISDNQTSQSTIANATTESRTSIMTSPQPNTPTTPAAPTTATAEQEEGQIDSSQKPVYASPKDTLPVVVDTQQSAIEQEERQVDSSQTNQVLTPSTASNEEERQEAVQEGATEKETPKNRCEELKNTNTINYTDEQVRRFKKEMEEVCIPEPDIPHEDAIELPHETEEDVEHEYSLLRKILSFFTPGEKEEFKKHQGLGINLTKLEETVAQETIIKESEKEEGGGLIASFIDKILSIFR